MSERVKNGAAYADLVTAPDDKIAEIVEGSLYLSPRPSLRHSNAASVLSSDLIDAFHRGRSGPGGWRILIEPELHLFGDVLVPDIAGWRLDRFSELPDTVGAEAAPDWLCEILSPSTKDFDRQRKLPRYAVANVGYVWLVEPMERALEVYERCGLDWLLLERYLNDAIVSAPPFEAIALELAPLWK